MPDNQFVGFDKKRRTKRIIKFTTALTLTTIGVLLTILVIYFDIAIIQKGLDNNAGLAMLFIVLFAVVAYLIGLVFAIIIQLSTLTLLLSNSKNRPRGLLLVYIINLVNLLSYIPLAIIALSMLKNG